MGNFGTGLVQGFNEGVGNLQRAQQLKMQADYYKAQATAAELENKLKAQQIEQAVKKEAFTKNLLQRPQTMQTTQMGPELSVAMPGPQITDAGLPQSQDYLQVPERQIPVEQPSLFEQMTQGMTPELQLFARYALEQGAPEAFFQQLLPKQEKPIETEPGKVLATPKPKGGGFAFETVPGESKGKQPDFGDAREALSAVESMKKYGQAMTYGELVKKDPKLAEQIDKTVGEERPVKIAAAKEQIPEKPGEGTRKELAEQQASAGRFIEIEKKYKPEFVGVKAGYLGKLQEQYGGFLGLPELSPEQAEFYTAIAAFNNKVINLLSGANVPPQEFARIIGELPRPEQPRATFEARMKQTKRNLQERHDLFKAVLASTGVDVSNVPALPEALAKPTEDDVFRVGLGVAGKTIWDSLKTPQERATFRKTWEAQDAKLRQAK